MATELFANLAEERFGQVFPNIVNLSQKRERTNFFVCADWRQVPQTEKILMQMLFYPCIINNQVLDCKSFSSLPETKKGGAVGPAALGGQNL